jgi:hypothetical protein
MPKFTYPNGYTFTAKRQVDGVLIDPTLPRNFDNTPNEKRPDTQARWWGFPFVRTMTVEEWDSFYAKRTDEHDDAGRKEWNEKGRAAWLAAWPSGTRYETRCLDGGAWDRSTSWGMFGTLEEAVACAKTGPARRAQP